MILVGYRSDLMTLRIHGGNGRWARIGIFTYCNDKPMNISTYTYMSLNVATFRLVTALSDCCWELAGLYTVIRSAEAIWHKSCRLPLILSEASCKTILSITLKAERVNQRYHVDSEHAGFWNSPAPIGQSD